MNSKSNYQAEHPFLHRIIRSNITTIIVLYALLAALLVAHDFKHYSLSKLSLLVLLGIFIWTLAEYFTHRFVFHGKRKSGFLGEFQYFMHGYHHDYPTDYSRLVLPLVLTIPVLALIFVSYRLLFGAGDAIFAGFIIGYIIYDLIHHSVHCYQPKNQVGKFFKYYHFHHHFKNPDGGFGVSTPIWDYVFGTKLSIKIKSTQASK